MPLTPYFTLVTTRGQRSIPRLIINPTRGQYHSNGTALMEHNTAAYIEFLQDFTDNSF